MSIFSSNKKSNFYFFSKEGNCFKTNKEGNNLFYPWACPGESFYANKSQKKKIKIFLGFFIALYVSLYLGIYIVYENGIIDKLENFWLIYIQLKIFLFWYCMQMYFFTKNLTPNISNLPKRPKILGAAIFFLCMEIILFSAGFMDAYKDRPNFLIASNTISCLSAIFFCVLLIFVLRYNGYILTKIHNHYIPTYNKNSEKKPSLRA